MASVFSQINFNWAIVIIISFARPDVLNNSYYSISVFFDGIARLMLKPSTEYTWTTVFNV